ncbi:MAG: ABC transporter ATP-binding protein [Ruminococcaceae bacterium]|nr:ABC transporter ATP-binding protein [Oscillospiraceae bacterium]
MSLSVNIKSAGYKNKPVLSDLNFNLEKGSFTAVIGRNGSGKSTLISALGGLLKFNGDMISDGVSLKELDRKERAKKLSAMLQGLKTPHVTVKELVSFGRNPYVSLNKPLSERDLVTINKAIEITSLTSLADSYMDSISGGEARRAYLAMILAQDTDIILLDESTAFMDASFENDFMKILLGLCRSFNKTILFVTHNIELAVEYADNILLMESGKQCFFGKTTELLNTDMIEKHFGLKRYVSENRTFFSVGRE